MSFAVSIRIYNMWFARSAGQSSVEGGTKMYADLALRQLLCLGPMGCPYRRVPCIFSFLL